MTLNEYQTFAAKGIHDATLEREPIVGFALGLVGETGEVVDDIKKRIYHGREIPIEHTEEELGDVLWYIANIATQCGLSLESIMEKNVNKLVKRYPEKYPELVEHSNEQLSLFLTIGKKMLTRTCLLLDKVSTKVLRCFLLLVDHISPCIIAQITNS